MPSEQIVSLVQPGFMNTPRALVVSVVLVGLIGLLATLRSSGRTWVITVSCGFGVVVASLATSMLQSDFRHSNLAPLAIMS